MSADIEKLAVFDDRIVQSRPKYAVEKGALSLTNSPFNAIAANGSQHTYNINVPSENVFVDRAVEWTSTCFLQATATCPNDPTLVGSAVVAMGRDFALAAFPLSSLAQTMTATINDTTTTMNTGDVLYEVLRLADYKKNRAQRTCPTYLDTYKSYNTAFGSINNPLGDYTNAVDSGSVPNGAWSQFVFTDPAGLPLGAGPANYVSGGVQVDYLNGVPIVRAVAGVVQTSYPIFLSFTSTEKLVLSPFVFSDTHEQDTGLFGIQNIQLVLNMTAPSTTAIAGRVIRQTSAVGCTLTNLAYNNSTSNGSPFANSRVNVQFLTPSLDIPLPPKSVVPYMEFPRFISSQSFSTPIAVGAIQSQIVSQTITLPQIPDLLIIYAKPTAYLATDADYHLPITQISINFDNFSGLLSSHTPEQLYAMAFRNGLDMDYSAWSGVGKTTGYSGSPTDMGGQANSALVGGFLVLKPSQDITLQSGQAPSLVGNFTFQFNCSVRNTSGAALSALNLYVITANSGFFESIKGSSRVIKGVLTEADIISAPLSPMGVRSQLVRAVGGQSVFSRLGNVLSKAKDFLPLAKAAAPLLKPMLPQGVQSLMSSVGMGQTGGAQTGGAATGGRRRKGLAERLM